MTPGRTSVVSTAGPGLPPPKRFVLSPDRDDAHIVVPDGERRVPDAFRRQIGGGGFARQARDRLGSECVEDAGRSDDDPPVIGGVVGDSLLPDTPVPQ